jgi:hypothetical protein
MAKKISMAFKVPPLWEDGECWILGGGFSMPRQFGIPENIIKEIIENKKPLSTYSPYLKLLHNKNVIGANKAFKIGNWINVMTFGDRGFFNKNKKELIDFPNLKIGFVNEQENYMHQKVGVRIIKRDNRKLGISKDRNLVCWNYNTGAASINIAVHFGVKRIYLLGFDMKAGGNGKTHWHGEYKKQINENLFKRHMKGFSKIKEDADRLGIEILNVSPNSAIKELKKVKLKDVL